MLNHVTEEKSENKLGQVRALKKPPSASLKNAIYDLPKALTVLILQQFYADRATDWIKKLNLTQMA